MTVASANFLAPLPSVAVALTVNVPLVAYVVMKLGPVPVAGLPPGADQEKVNEPVPPDAEALHVTGFPAVAEPQVTVTVMPVGGTTIMSCVAVADAPFASCAVRSTWNAVDTVTV